MTATVRDTFGEPISYWRFGTATDAWLSTAQDGSPLTGVFDPDAAVLEAGGDVGVNSTAPVLEVRISDLGFDPDEQDKVRLRGKTYKVVNAPESSSRTVKLQLRKTGNAPA